MSITNIVALTAMIQDRDLQMTWDDPTRTALSETASGYQRFVVLRAAGNKAETEARTQVVYHTIEDRQHFDDTQTNS